MIEQWTNEWWGVCVRASPDANWCVTHATRINIKSSQCIAWKSYVDFAHKIIYEYCKEEDV